MMPLLIATTNAGKIKEFKELLEGRFQVLFPNHFPNIEQPEAEENGKSYEENAFKKAKAFYDRYQQLTLADDSGVEVDALDGEPGLYSARFGGTSIAWPERWNLLYKRLGKVDPKLWTAKFISVLCYFDGTTPRYFRGETLGTIVTPPRGQKGFGYDPIFVVDGTSKTFSEMDDAEKNSCSHRAVAVQRLLRVL